MSNNTMEAKCNCGAVRVKVKDDDKPLFGQDVRRGHICHCFNCRKTAGSAWATNLIIERSKVTMTGEDNLSLYEDKGSLSGNTVRRFFCKTCGNPIKSETEAASKNGMVILKLGIFPEIPTPERQTFFNNRHPWVEPLKGAPHYKVAFKPDEPKGDWNGEGRVGPGSD